MVDFSPPKSEESKKAGTPPKFDDLKKKDHSNPVNDKGRINDAGQKLAAASEPPPKAKENQNDDKKPESSELPQKGEVAPFKPSEFKDTEDRGNERTGKRGFDRKIEAFDLRLKRADDKLGSLTANCLNFADAIGKTRAREGTDGKTENVSSWGLAERDLDLLSEIPYMRRGLKVEKALFLISSGKDEDVRNGEKQLGELVRDNPSLQADAKFHDGILRSYELMAARRKELGLPAWSSQLKVGDILPESPATRDTTGKTARELFQQAAETFQEKGLNEALPGFKKAFDKADSDYQSDQKSRLEMFLTGMKVDAEIATKHVNGEDVEDALFQRADRLEKESRVAGDSKEIAETRRDLGINLALAKIACGESSKFQEGKKELLGFIDGNPALVNDEGFRENCFNAFKAYYQKTDTTNGGNGKEETKADDKKDTKDAKTPEKELDLSKAYISKDIEQDKKLDSYLADTLTSIGVTVGLIGMGLYTSSKLLRKAQYARETTRRYGVDSYTDPTETKEASKPSEKKVYTREQKDAISNETSTRRYSLKGATKEPGSSGGDRAVVLENMDYTKEMDKGAAEKAIPLPDNFNPKKFQFGPPDHPFQPLKIDGKLYFSRDGVVFEQHGQKLQATNRFTVVPEGQFRRDAAVEKVANLATEQPGVRGLDAAAKFINEQIKAKPDIKMAELENELKQEAARRPELADGFKKAAEVIKEVSKVDPAARTAPTGAEQKESKDAVPPAMESEEQERADVPKDKGTEGGGDRSVADMVKEAQTETDPKKLKKIVAKIADAEDYDASMQGLRDLASGDSKAAPYALEHLASYPGKEDIALISKLIEGGEVANWWKEGKLDGAKVFGALKEGAFPGERIKGLMNKVAEQLSERPDLKIKLYANVFGGDVNFIDSMIDVKPAEFPVEVRREALSKLVELKPGDLPERIKALGRDPDPEIRKIAKGALDKICDTPAAPGDGEPSRPRLLEGRIVEDFVKGAGKLDWSEPKGTAEQYKKFIKDCQKLDKGRESFISKVNDEVPHPNEDFSVRDLWDQPEEMRRHLKDHPELLDQYNKLHAEEQRLVEQRQGFNQIIEKRRAQLEVELNKANRDAGLMDTHLVVKGRLRDARGTYGVGENKVRVLEEDILLARDHPPAELLKTILHEAGHHDQADLVLRSVFDDLKIEGNSLTDPQKRIEVKQKFLDRCGYELSDEFLDGVLKSRKGKHLDAHERVRADKLAESFKDLSYGADGNAKETIAYLDKQIGLLVDLKAPLVVVLGSDLNDTVRMQKLFGTDQAPQEIRDLFKRAEELSAKKDSTGASKVYSEISEKLVRVLESRRNGLALRQNRTYRQRFHEVETHQKIDPVTNFMTDYQQSTPAGEKAEARGILGDQQRKALDEAKRILDKDAPGLNLRTLNDTALKSMLEEALKQIRDPQAKNALVELLKDFKGDDIRAYLAPDGGSGTTAKTAESKTPSGLDPGNEGESTRSDEVRRRLVNATPFDEAKATELRRSGKILETLKADGMDEKRAKELEEKLTSKEAGDRAAALREIDKFYDDLISKTEADASRPEGKEGEREKPAERSRLGRGWDHFAKKFGENKGKIGTLIVVVAPLLPLVLNRKAEAEGEFGGATFSK